MIASLRSKWILFSFPLSPPSILPLLNSLQSFLQRSPSYLCCHGHSKSWINIFKSSDCSKCFVIGATESVLCWLAQQKRSLFQIKFTLHIKLIWGEKNNHVLAIGGRQNVAGMMMTPLSWLQHLEQHKGLRRYSSSMTSKDVLLPLFSHTETEKDNCLSEGKGVRKYEGFWEFIKKNQTSSPNKWAGWNKGDTFGQQWWKELAGSVLDNGCRENTGAAYLFKKM